MQQRNPHRVVIVGGGFAGLKAARTLQKSPEIDVTLVDRRNHHLFQPLLYQVATGGLSPADIAVPIRGLFSRRKNVRVLLGEVENIDVEGRRVLLADGEIPYDTLMIATGATHAYFGHPEWAERAPGLKTIDDATDIRRRILFAFEAAERTHDEAERKAWMTLVVVGAGPTGVELAGSLGELTRHTLRHDFRTIDTAEARILLVEGADRVLRGYDEKLGEDAEEMLRRLGVELVMSTFVTEIDDDGVTFGSDGEETFQPAKTVMWAAGVASSPLGERLKLDRMGRVIVEPDLTVPGHPEIFVAGDLACFKHQGKHHGDDPLRGTADVAQAEGAYIGKAIRRRLEGRDVAPFHFRDLGKLAVIGRSAAIADLGIGRFSGFLAWLFWLFIHLMKLVDFQNRLTVFLQWGWSYTTRKRSARLITGKIRRPFERMVGADEGGENGENGENRQGGEDESEDA